MRNYHKHTIIGTTTYCVQRSVSGYFLACDSDCTRMSIWTCILEYVQFMYMYVYSAHVHTPSFRHLENNSSWQVRSQREGS